MLKIYKKKVILLKKKKNTFYITFHCSGGEHHYQHEHKKRGPCITGILGNSVSSSVVYKGGLAYVCLPNHVVIMQETTKTK